MKRVVVSAEADAEVRSIYRFTWRKWGEARADTYVAQFHDAYVRLANGTAMGRFFRNIDGMEVRRLEVGRHIVVFALRENAVLVLQVFHDRMDVLARLERLIPRLKSRGAI